MGPASRPRDGETYEAVTRGIRVVVSPRFQPEHSDPQRGRFVWAYAVRIENQGVESVRLVSRHWIITDDHNRVEEIRGPGVVGEQPLLEPGERFEYSSGCPLAAPSGAMRGTYQMVTEGGESFEATIPAFSLHLPGAKSRLN